MNTFNIVESIFIILALVSFIIIGAILSYHRKRNNYDKEKNWVTVLIILLIIYVIILFATAVHDMVYLSGFEEGIYSIDVSKLEEISSKKGNSALEPLYDAVIEMGEEVKISRAGDNFLVIFPSESYDTEITISVNYIEVLEENSVISLVKEQ